MTGFFYGYQATDIGPDCLQHRSLPERYEPVFFAMQDNDRALDFFDKQIGPDLVPQQPFQGQKENKTTYIIMKTEIRTIQDQHFRLVPGSHAGSESAAE